MEKFKAFWLSFLRWPGWIGWLKWKGWKKIAVWPGWTAWLKWSGWKKIGNWEGWKKLLYPHPVLVIVLTLIAGAGLPWVFLTGRENSMIAYPLYCVAFYALVTLTLLIVKLVPKARKKAEADPLIQKLTQNEEVSFSLGLYMEQLLNFGYGIFKLISGAIHASAWIGADGLYNFVQSLIQLYQILRRKKVTTMKDQWKSYRQCGYMMIVLHLTMTGMVFQMIHMGRHENSTEIGIIATAAFTFYKLIKAFVDVAKDRKHKSPVDSAVRFLDFSQALYNLFVLQVGLLWVFGGSGFAYAKLMNSLTGGAVCLLVCGMGVYMVWRANRDMRDLEETEIG